MQHPLLLSWGLDCIQVMDRGEQQCKCLCHLHTYTMKMLPTYQPTNQSSLGQVMHGKERWTLTVLITNSDRIVLSRITSCCIRQKKKRATIKTHLVQMINVICKTATFSVFVRDKWNVNSKYSESYNTASHIWYLPLWLWHLEVECMIILPVEDNYWFKKGQLQLLSQEKTTIERTTD